VWTGQDHTGQTFPLTIEDDRSSLSDVGAGPLQEEDVVDTVPPDTEALDTHRISGHGGANPEPDMHGASTGWQRELASAD
jgi:hypothetical protein